MRQQFYSLVSHTHHSQHGLVDALPPMTSTHQLWLPGAPKIPHSKKYSLSYFELPCKQLTISGCLVSPDLFFKSWKWVAYVSDEGKRRNQRLFRLILLLQNYSSSVGNNTGKQVILTHHRRERDNGSVIEYLTTVAGEGPVRTRTSSCKAGSFPESCCIQPKLQSCSPKSSV